jgi:hypothetical protein
MPSSARIVATASGWVMYGSPLLRSWLPLLAHGHEAHPEAHRQRRTEDEAARLDARHHVDVVHAERGEPVDHGVEHGRHALGVGQQRRYVAEGHARLRPVRDGPDPGVEQGVEVHLFLRLLRVVFVRGCWRGPVGVTPVCLRLSGVTAVPVSASSSVSTGSSTAVAAAAPEADALRPLLRESPPARRAATRAWRAPSSPAPAPCSWQRPASR